MGSRSGGNSDLYSSAKESSRRRSRRPEEGVAESASRGPKQRIASAGGGADEYKSSSSRFQENSRRENVVKELKQLRLRVQSLEKKVTEQRQAILQLERSNSAITEDVSEIVSRVERAYTDAKRLRSPPRIPWIIPSHNNHRSGRISCSSSVRWDSRFSPPTVAGAAVESVHPVRGIQRQGGPPVPPAIARGGVWEDVESRCTIREDGRSFLFPGLPDEITINRILILVPWSKLYLLSMLNRSWEHAFRGRFVHDARVRSGATETLFVLSHPSLVSLQKKSYDKNKLALALYNSARNAWHCLPSPVDGVAKTWRLGHFEAVFLDGRLYVLGGLFKDANGVVLHRGDEVHVLDLGACESVWKRCASMSVARERFGCAAYDGKIFVFGGLFPEANKYDYECRDREIWSKSEVFDPGKNEWSPVQSMPLGRMGHSVVEFGGELYMYGGSSRPSGWSLYANLDDMKDADFTHAYHPAADGWRPVENFSKTCPQGALISCRGHNARQSCILDVTQDAIFRYEDSPFGYRRSRIQSHKMYSPGWSEGQCVSSCVAVKNELYALLVFRKKHTTDSGNLRYGTPEAVLLKRWFDFLESSSSSSESGSMSPSSLPSSSSWTPSTSEPRQLQPPAFAYLENQPPTVQELCAIRSRIVSVQL